MAESIASSTNSVAERTESATRWWNAPMPERPFWKDALHIFAIFNFAVAYPILDRVGQNGWFFVAERASTLDILLVAAIPCLLVPAVLAGLLGLVQVVRPQARSVLHVCFVALMAVVGLQLTLNSLTSENPGSPLSLLAVGVAIAGTLLYLYAQTVQLFATILLISVVAVPAQFLFMSEVGQVLFASDPDGEEAIVVDTQTPVVVIVYDELPLHSLLDRNREIDPVRYPNFARLAADSHWFRNGTTVQESTRHAIPAIATGTLPDITRTPTASQYPRNVFTLLKGSHELIVSEPATELCPNSLCQHDYAFSNSRMPSFFSALTARRTPEIVVNPDRPLLDQQLVQRISNSEKPAAVFHHSMLPHHPWRHLPSGTKFQSFQSRLAGLDPSNEWTVLPGAVNASYQRHLLQVEYTDSLLGVLLDRLESEGIYDDALIILTTDHGISFQPGEPHRHYQPETASDIALVPFFVKLPGQTEQVVSDRNVEIIDILPTIVDVLEIDVDWEFDGESVFSTGPEREHKSLVHNVTGEHLELPPYIGGLEEAVERKIEIFGDGSDPDGLFRYGPYGDLVGIAVEVLDLSEDPAYRIEIDNEGTFQNVDPDSSFVPALVEGSIEVDDDATSESLHVAIAVNGVIQSVPEIFELDGQLQFSTVVPEESFVAGHNQIDAYVLSDGFEPYSES